MMKKYIVLAIAALMATGACAQKVEKQTEKKWKMVWNDEFNGTKVDDKKWTPVARGTSHWDRFMSNREGLVEVKNGNVLMHGIINPDRTTDTAPYLTGGLYSQDKYAFLYGKIEIRAKLQSVQGAWPAFWLLPQGVKYPDGGEIDIMEHLNFDNAVYQTVHSNYTIKLGIKDNPKHHTFTKINRDEYNVYGVEITPDALIFSVNGKHTFTYPKIKTDKEGQWPFNSPFFILIDQQLGGPGTWVGEVDKSQLPVTMWIDYVRVYEEKK